MKDNYTEKEKQHTKKVLERLSLRPHKSLYLIFSYSALQWLRVQSHSYFILYIFCSFLCQRCESLCVSSSGRQLPHTKTAAAQRFRPLDSTSDPHLHNAPQAVVLRPQHRVHPLAKVRSPHCSHLTGEVHPPKLPLTTTPPHLAPLSSSLCPSLMQSRPQLTQTTT